jgi:5-oxoprolinase (ATP-hydrolysing)
VDPAARAASVQSTYFKGHGRVATPVFRLPDLRPGEVVVGPALLVDNTATIVLVPGTETTVTSSHILIELV